MAAPANSHPWRRGMLLGDQPPGQRNCPECGIFGPHQAGVECITALRSKLGESEIRNEGLRRHSLRSSQRKRAERAQMAAQASVVAYVAQFTQAPREIKQIVQAWKFRDCFVCGERGWCAHREPEFELALIRRGD
jgi:hypothetical protein